MNELVSTAIIAILGGLVGALSQVLVARFARTKQERDSGLASEYLKLADMSGDQLEKRINLIGKLEQKINDMDERRAKRDEEILVERNARDLEIAELKMHRRDRDEKIQDLERRVAEQGQRIETDMNDTRVLHEKYQKLKEFTETLIAALEKKGINLPELNGGIPESIKGWRWDKK